MSKKLRELLKEKGIPQSVVAAALNIEPPNLVRYDDLKRRSIYEVEIISKATGIDISELIGISIEGIVCEESEIYGLREENIKKDRIISDLQEHLDLLREKKVADFSDLKNQKGKSA